MSQHIKPISTHTPLAGRDQNDGWIYRYLFRFQLTRPLRGATIHRERFFENLGISTHTPLAGRDLCLSRLVRCCFHFNSHAPCGARLVVRNLLKRCRVISTHTPLAGRDPRISADWVVPPQDADFILSDFSEITIFSALFPRFSREPLRDLISPAVRVILSARLRGHRFPLHRYVQFCFSNYSQDNISSSCPVRD